MKKKMKVMIISILFMGLMTLNSVAMGFNDVSDNQWFYNSVTKMTEQGIFKGYPDGTFKPDNTVTYGEFIKMFVVAVTGEDVGNNTTGQGHWAKNYYDKGIELGLYTEYDIPEYRLEDGIARKYMALLISNNFKDIEIENYNLIKDRISDLESGRPYQHQIVKAYGSGIITGYPGGEFKPNGTLTRAESATVISRLLNEDERIIPKFEKPIADDSYWKNDPDYVEMVEWYEYGRVNKRYITGANFKIVDGKIVFIKNDGTEWVPDTTKYPKMNKHVYIVLKAYYEYAKDKDMGIFVNSMYEHDIITIGLRENKVTHNTLFYFSFSGTPIIYEDEPNYVLPYVMYNQSRYFTQKDIDKYGDELFLSKKRIGDESLIELNRGIFKKLYGDETGNKIMDYAVKIYKDTFDETVPMLIDMPNSRINIDGINIFYYDNVTNINALYMDQPNND